eukprot:EG_transcript_56960
MKPFIATERLFFAPAYDAIYLVSPRFLAIHQSLSVRACGCCWCLETGARGFKENGGRWWTQWHKPWSHASGLENLSSMVKKQPAWLPCKALNLKLDIENKCC